MATKLTNPDGSTVDYTDSNYNMQSQKVEDPPIKPNRNVNFSPYQTKSGVPDQYAPTQSLPKVSYAQRDLDKDYDVYGGLESWDNMQQRRIKLQSDSDRAARAVFGGLAKGVGTAIKEIGYMADPVTYLNLIPGVEMDGTLSSAGEFLSNQVTAGVDNAMPIYEDNSSDDIFKQLSKWSTASSILDSGLGFMIPGVLASKAGTLALKTTRGFGKLLRFTGEAAELTGVQRMGAAVLKSEGWIRQLATSAPNRLKNAANVLGPAVLQAHGEAVWESKDAKEQFIKKLSPHLFNNSRNLKEINNAAESIAEQTYWLNMGKAVLNLNMFNSMAKKYGNGIIKKPSAWKVAGSMALELPLQGLEENQQEVFKAEAEYDAVDELNKLRKNSPIINDLKRTGNYNNDKLSKDAVIRWGQLSSTNQAITSFLIGAISGPVQMGMVNLYKSAVGQGPIKEYKEQMKAYEEQKKLLEGTGALFKSKKLYYEAVDRAILHEDFSKIADKLGGQEDLIPLQEHKMYGEEIMQHLAKGTFSALEQMAKENKDNDPHMAAMYKYIQTVKPHLKAAEGMLNKEQIVDLSFSVEMNKKLASIFERRLAELKSTKETNPDSDPTIDLKIQDIGESLEILQESTSKLNDNLTALKSRKVQNELLNIQIREKNVVDGVNRVKQARTIKELEKLKNFERFSGIEKTSTYQTKMEEIVKNGGTLKKASKVNTKTQKKPKTTDTVVEEKAKESVQETVGTSEGFQPIATVESVADELRNSTDPEISAAVAQLSEEEIGEIALTTIAKHNKKLKEYTQEQYENDAETDVFIDTVTSLAEHIQTNRKDVQAKQEEQNASTSESSQMLDSMIEQRYAFQKKDEELEQIKVEIKGAENEAELAAELEQDIEKHSREKTEFALSLKGAVGAYITRLENELGKGSFLEMFPTFKDYIQHIINDRGAEYADNHYATLQSLYRTINPEDESVSSTFEELLDLNDDILVDPEMPTSQKLSMVDKVFSRNSKVDVTKSFSDVVNEAGHTPTSAAIEGAESGRDATTSIAHLSVSYHMDKDDNGDDVVRDDTDPAIELSPILDPEDFNGGQKVTFKVMTDISTYINLKIGSRTKVLFSSIKKFLIDPATGEVRDKNDPVFVEWKTKQKLDIEASPEDYIPIGMYGPNGEFLGYMHQPNWLLKLTDKDQARIQFRVMQQKRAKVFNSYRNKSDHTGTIIDKTIDKTEEGNYTGFVMNRERKVKGKPKSRANKAMEDKSLTVDLVTAKGPGTGNIKKSQVFNMEEVEGLPAGIIVTYVPIGKNSQGEIIYHGEPLYNTRLDPNLQRTAVALVKAFITRGKENAKLVEDYNTEFGIDITTVEGLREALGQFMYVMDVGMSELDRLSGKKKNSGTNAILNLNENGELHFGLRALSSVMQLAQEDIDNYSPEMIEEDVAILDNLLKNGKFLFNANAKALKHKGRPKVLFVQEDGTHNKLANSVGYVEFTKMNTETTLHGSKLANGKYTYTLQNIVNYSVDDTQFPITSDKIAESVAEAEKKVVPVVEKDLIKDNVTVKEKEQISVLEKHGVVIKDASGNIVPLTSSVELDDIKKAVKGDQALAEKLKENVGASDETLEKIITTSLFYRSSNPVGNTSMFAGIEKHEVIKAAGPQKVKEVQDAVSRAYNESTLPVSTIEGMLAKITDGTKIDLVLKVLVNAAERAPITNRMDISKNKC